MWHSVPRSHTQTQILSSVPLDFLFRWLLSVSFSQFWPSGRTAGWIPDMKCCFQAEVVHLEYMVSGLSGRRHLAQIQNKLDVSMAHKKVKKLYVYIFPTLTSASTDWSGLSWSLCRTMLTRPYLEAFTPNTWPEATGKLTEALENKQPRRDGLFSSRLPIQMDAARECADKDVPALERGAQTRKQAEGGK